MVETACALRVMEALGDDAPVRQRAEAILRRGPLFPEALPGVGEVTARQVLALIKNAAAQPTWLETLVLSRLNRRRALTDRPVWIPGLLHAHFSPEQIMPVAELLAEMAGVELIRVKDTRWEKIFPPRHSQSNRDQLLFIYSQDPYLYTDKRRDIHIYLTERALTCLNRSDALQAV